ncbi:MAG: hypothetical protein PHY12_13780, partial [Eubacteriales bacterium]|nr:hypothetical protein [Eubacteriales bacterium]
MAGAAKRLASALAAGWLLLFACAPRAARAEDGSCERRALLVGVDDFVSRESTYPSSTNNVFAMQEVFQ